MTERYGSPQTLVITKTHDNVARELKKWEQRVKEARKWMSDLGKHDLEQLLCPNYEDLGMFQSIRTTGTSISTNQRTPMADLSGRMNQAAGQTESSTNRGVKRKAEPEVIDLTGQDW